MQSIEDADSAELITIHIVCGGLQLQSMKSMIMISIPFVYFDQVNGFCLNGDFPY